MTDSLILLRFLHVIGATVILGTGMGIAFFMWLAHRTKEPSVVAPVAQMVVTADLVFTATAVVAQPVTGLGLALEIGWPLTEPWLLLAIALYVMAGLCWLPVVVIQLRLRDLARTALDDGAALPRAYHRLFRLWLMLGVPAFLAVLAIVWLMLARPQLGP